MCWINVAIHCVMNVETSRSEFENIVVRVGSVTMAMVL